jgi:hypothetical protein
VMGAPPSELGGSHDTLSPSGPGVTFMFRGGNGALAPTTTFAYATSSGCMAFARLVTLTTAAPGASDT